MRMAIVFRREGKDKVKAYRLLNKQTKNSKEPCFICGGPCWLSDLKHLRGMQCFVFDPEIVHWNTRQAELRVHNPVQFDLNRKYQIPVLQAESTT